MSDNGITAVLNGVMILAPVQIVGELTTITLDAHLGGSASFTNFQENALLAPEP